LHEHKVGDRVRVVPWNGCSVAQWAGQTGSLLTLEGYNTAPPGDPHFIFGAVNGRVLFDSPDFEGKNERVFALNFLEIIPREARSGAHG
jgi:hypothetical protein